MKQFVNENRHGVSPYKSLQSSCIEIGVYEVDGDRVCMKLTVICESVDRICYKVGFLQKRSSNDFVIRLCRYDNEFHFQ